MPSETKTIETFVEKPKAFSELRKGIVAGSVKSVDLTASYYERIEQANPRLNVYLSLTKERALEQAAKVDATAAKGDPLPPLAGIPGRHQRCAGHARSSFNGRIEDSAGIPASL